MLAPCRVGNTRFQPVFEQRARSQTVWLRARCLPVGYQSRPSAPIAGAWNPQSVHPNATMATAEAATTVTAGAEWEAKAEISLYCGLSDRGREDSRGSHST